MGRGAEIQGFIETKGNGQRHGGGEGGQETERGTKDNERNETGSKNQRETETD